MKKAEFDSRKQLRSYRRIPAAYDKDLYALVVELCQKHLRQYPEDFFVWGWLAMAKTNLHCYDDAEQAIRRAMRGWKGVKMKPELACGQMGHVFKGRGDDATAQRWYRRASKHDPKDAKYHIYLGDLAFVRGHLSQAEVHFRRAIRCEDGPIEEAYYNLGGVLTAKRNYAGAIVCYRKAIQIDRNYRLAEKQLRDAKLALELRGS